MTTRFLSLLLIAFSLLTACSTHEPGVFREGSIGIKMEGSPFVAFNIWVHCGSRNDPAGKEGLAAMTAAFLTHSATEFHSYEEVLDRLFPMATSYDATVDKEMTNFTGYVHRDNLEDYYVLFRDAILAPAFAPEDFERVKTETMNYVQRERRFSNDEELTKELLFREIYRNTVYEHPEEGYVSSVRSISLDDVKSFYSKYYTRNNITVAVGGGFPPGFKRRVRTDFDVLPEAKTTVAKKVVPDRIEGIHVLLVEKDTDSSPVSIGFPTDFLRSDDDFFAMMLFNSAFGEHRNFRGRLFQVIRNARGLNYGDYTYIEAFPRGYTTQLPPVNVGRLSQIFEIWLRPVSASKEGTLHNRTLFAIRAAIRELNNIATTGMSRDMFEATGDFLRNFTVHYGNSMRRRLAYRIDDAFYGLPEPGFLASIRPKLQELTLKGVNATIRRHIQTDNLWIVVITKDAAGLKQKLVSGSPTPIQYPSPQTEEISAEDTYIESFPIPVTEANIRIMGIREVFEN